LQADVNGNYTIRVFEGNYVLLAYEYGYNIQFYKDASNSFNAASITVNSENLNVTSVDFNLTRQESGSNTVSGYVTNKGIEVLPGVSVCAIPLSGGICVEAITGYNGKFFLSSLKNGKYILLFSKENFVTEFYNNSIEWENAYIFDLQGSQYISNIYMHLQPLDPFGGEISGKVSTSLDTALSGVLISAVNSSGEIISSTVSGCDGRYLVNCVQNGDYTIKASKIGYITSEYPDKVQVDLLNQPIVEGVDFSIAATGIKDEKNEVPKYFNLSQNYPNPFNPVTSIKYELPSESNVQLVIYNLLGEKAAELVNKFQKAGRYEVEWNAENFSSGVYIYQIRTARFSSSKKLILIK
jgi:hypothetical protein